MANLAEAVDATETDWLVSADVPQSTEYLTVESEVVQVLAHFPSSIDPQTLAAVPPRIRVARAAGGTTAASHADTTALTPLIPPSAGGSSSVPDPSTGDEGDVLNVQAGEYALTPSAGLQTIRLLALSIEEDTAGITAMSGAVIGTLPAGTTALMCSVALSGDWTATDEDVVPLLVNVEMSLDPEVMMGLFAVSDIAGDSGALGDLYSAFTQPAQAFWANQSVINTGVARNIRAFVNNASGFPTPARADIHVLIAEPA